MIDKVMHVNLIPVGADGKYAGTYWWEYKPIASDGKDHMIENMHPYLDIKYDSTAWNHPPLDFNLWTTEK